MVWREPHGQSDHSEGKLTCETLCWFLPMFFIYRKRPVQVETGGPNTALRNKGKESWASEGSPRERSEGGKRTERCGEAPQEWGARNPGADGGPGGGDGGEGAALGPSGQPWVRSILKFPLLWCDTRDFPGGPVIKTPTFHCRGHRFDPWSGN